MLQKPKTKKSQDISRNRVWGGNVDFSKKRVVAICDVQKLCVARNTFLSVFTKAQPLQKGVQVA